MSFAPKIRPRYKQAIQIAKGGAPYLNTKPKFLEEKIDMKRLFSVIVILSMLIAPNSIGLLAQEEDEEDIITLETFDVLEDAERRGYQSNLIIGANRMTISIDEMATSAFVINSDFIEDLNPRYMTDVTRYVAGVSGSDNYDVVDGVDIRSNELGTNLVDGFPVVGLNYVPIALVEQIEVVKGPQGVLYGQISAGGFFNRVMKKPEFENSGEIMFEVGSYGYYGGMIDFTGTHPDYGNGDLAYRFIASIKEGGARQDNLQTNRPEKTLAGGFKYALAGGGYVSVMVDFTDRVVSFAEQVTFGDERTGLPNFDLHRDHATYTSLRTEQDNLRISTILEKRFGPIDARFSYQYNDHYWEDDALFPWGVFDVAPTAARFRANQYINHNFFFDGVWRPTFGGMDNIVNFGFSYDKSDKEDIQIINFALDPSDYPVTDINNPHLDIRFNHGSPNNNMNRDAVTFSDFYSLYGNWRASFADGRVNLIGGVRYQNYEAGGSSLLPGAGPVPTKDDDTTLFRAGGVFKVVPGVNVWASFGETFNISSGLAPTREGESILFLPDPGAENIEGGIKIALWDRKLNMTATYYTLTQTGRTASGSSSLIPIVPVDDSTNKGIEFQATAEPTPGWLVVASFTDQNIRNASGDREPDDSEFMANFWTKYTVQEGSMSGLGAGFGVVHWGDRLPRGVPGTGFGGDNQILDFIIPGVTIFDATVSFERGPWRFAFNGRNLGDKIYINKTSGSFGAHWISNGRTWSITSSYRW